MKITGCTTSKEENAVSPRIKGFQFEIEVRIPL
jgi:hypothetical protein